VVTFKGNILSTTVVKEAEKPTFKPPRISVNVATGKLLVYDADNGK
jgi:hypothetical protein